MKFFLMGTALLCVFSSPVFADEYILELPNTMATKSKADGADYLKASLEVLKQKKLLKSGSTAKYLKGMESKVLKAYHIVDANKEDIDSLMDLKLIKSATLNSKYELLDYWPSNLKPSSIKRNTFVDKRVPKTTSLNSFNDKFVSYQWGFQSSGFDRLPEQFRSIQNQAKVFIVDTWVDKNHPDFNSTQIADVISFLPLETQQWQSQYVRHYHGTHVAGIISATTNNEQGIAGNLSNVSIHPLEVCSYNGCPMTSIAEAITYAADSFPDYRGPRVVSMSLGAPTYSRIISYAIEYALSKDVTIVAAAGNSYSDTINFYPAAFPGVISVGALENKRTWDTQSTLLEDKYDLAYYSNYGDKSLNVLAPGSDILSTLPASYIHLPPEAFEVIGVNLVKNEAYGFLDGTSMAAPMVTAAVAALRAHSPHLKNYEIKKMLNVFQPKISITGQRSAANGSYSVLDVNRLLEGSTQVFPGFVNRSNLIRETVQIDIANTFTRRFASTTHVEGYIGDCDSPDKKVRIRWLEFTGYVTYAPSSYGYSIRDCNSRFEVEIPIGLPEEVGLFTAIPFLMAFIEDVDEGGNTSNLNPVLFQNDYDFLDLRTISRNE